MTLPKTYWLVSFLFGALLFSMGVDAAVVPDASISAQFKVVSVTDSRFEAQINVVNEGPRSFERHWQLALSTSRVADTLKGATVVQQVGDYVVLDVESPLPSGGAVQLDFGGQLSNKQWHKTDSPAGFFIIAKGEQTPILVDTKTPILPQGQSVKADTLFAQNRERNATSIEGNPVDPAKFVPVLTKETSLIVPQPAAITRGQGTFLLRKQIKIIAENGNRDALQTAEFLKEALAPATGIDFDVQANRDYVLTKSGAVENAIFLTTDKKIKKEGAYVLEVKPSYVVIRAKDAVGLFYGVQSLRQLLPPEIFSDHKQTVSWTMPSVTINDAPRFAYRGMHLDVVRHFIPVKQVKRYLDLMASLKLNQFHWHLSDDEGWRVEIKAYPQLTDPTSSQSGAWRGYGRALLPAFGSGANKNGGYYTQEEIKSIVAYAKARHITILPEIDVPGHARALIQSLPNLLIDTADQSRYTSVQGYHDNVLSPCLESTYTVIDNIMGEIAALFPGQYIHVGADEQPADAWTDSATCRTFMSGHGLGDTDQLRYYFLKRVQDIIQSKGKSLAGWEEVIASGPMDVNTARIYSWQGVDAGVAAAEQGYDVVMTPAQNLYFDLAYSNDPSEPGYYWAGFVDTFAAYSYSPLTSTMLAEVKDRIVGVQGALWSESVGSNWYTDVSLQDQMDYLAFPKMAALAELAWTPKTRRNWADFSRRLGAHFLPQLDAYGVQYRLPVPGMQIDASGALVASVAFPGLALKYSTDGKMPTWDSPTYEGPFHASSATWMRAFGTLHRGGRAMLISE